MTDITPDDPHTHRFPLGHASAWQVVYWRAGAASGSKNADCAELQQFIASLGYCSIENFDLPAGRHRLDRWLDALERAHAAGRSAKAAEIRGVLEIEERR